MRRWPARCACRRNLPPRRVGRSGSASSSPPATRQRRSRRCSPHWSRSGATEVIVVDDASTDATAAGRSRPRRPGGATRRRPADRLDGQGVRLPSRRGERHRRHCCCSSTPTSRSDRGRSTASSAAHAQHGGLISVQPYHRIASAVRGAVGDLQRGGDDGHWRLRSVASRAPTRRLRTLSSDERDDYVAVGGHAAVREPSSRTSHSPVASPRTGYRCTVFAGWSAVEFRMYPEGVRQLVEGWTKNLASGVRLVDPVSAAIAVWWVSACIWLTAVALRLVAVGEQTWRRRWHSRAGRRSPSSCAGCGDGSARSDGGRRCSTRSRSGRSSSCSSDRRGSRSSGVACAGAAARLRSTSRRTG